MAGSNAIGTGAVMLTANADGLASGLDSAGAAVKGWGSKIGGLISGGLKASGILMIVDVMVKAISSPFDKLKELGRNAKDASALGVGASQFMGLTKVLARVGIEGDAAGHTLAKMGKNIADASQGHGRAFPALQALGIDAQALMGIPIDQQFLKVADAISKLPPGAEQASAAMHIFGEQGAALLPMLQKGAGGIQGYIDDLKKTGAVLSDTQLAAAGKSAKAWKESKLAISNAWDGLVNRVTVAIAPVIATIGNAISKIFAIVTPVFDWLGRYWAQAGQLIEITFKEITKAIEGVIEWVKGLISELGAFGGELPTIQDVAVMVFRAIGMAGALMWDTLKAGAGALTIAASFVVDGFGVLVKVFKEIITLAKRLPDDLRPKWLDSLIEGTDRFEKKVHGTADKMRNWGKGAVTSWGESAKQFNSWLDKALAKKPAVVDAANAAMAAGGAAWEPAKLAGAIEAGTKEAYSISVRQQYGFEVQQMDVHKENGKKLDKIGKGIDRIGGVVDKVSVGAI